MVLGISYEEACEKLGGETGRSHSYYCDVWDQTISENGWAVQRKWGTMQPGNQKRDPWPLAPWADLHECEVKTSMIHSVLLLANGTVMDPLTTEPKRLSDYSEVLSMAALYPVDALRAQLATARADAERARAENVDAIVNGAGGLYLKELRAKLAALSAECEALREDKARLRFALLAQKYSGEGQCFCEMSIGNPMYKTHSNSCRIATETLAAIDASKNAGKGA
jgi:outer membrane murein-binding lipoprotein Lpp